MTFTATSDRVEVDLDPIEFMEHAARSGWGDGLPLIPPTEERVATMLGGTTRPPEEVLAMLPPSGGACTVEKVAINAVMAGAPPASMPLLCAAIAATIEPRFELSGINATTGSAIPALFVNGPVRDELGLTSAEGCFGGAATAAPAIGRALRLIMRNVAGQLVGVTSQAVFGQPARVTGILVAEDEEQSPWAPLAERRGVAGNALTAFAAMGTMNIADSVGTSAMELLKITGASLAVPGANGFLIPCPSSEVLVALNPVWAKIIAKDIPSMEHVQIVLWEETSRAVSLWPTAHQNAFEEAGRIDKAGLVHLCPGPQDVIVLVCGGGGGLHAMGLHSWGNTGSVTVPITE